MNTKSSAHYQREYRRRLRESGLVKKEVWVHPDNAKQLSKVEKLLREPSVELAGSLLAKGEVSMTNLKTWTTNSLYEALQQEPGLADSASVELMDGEEPALHIVMKAYGDLPLFLTVSGDQIVVEAVLWEMSEVNDVAAFNETVLRTHKYFPLSTIGLETLSSGAYYFMFGALSAGSILPSILFEIETLASNVIQATEAYADYININIPLEAKS